MENHSSEILKSSSVERVSAVAAIVAIGAGALVVGYFNPTTAGFFPACPLHAMTGLNCPGCGLTRGFHALLHGDVVSALRFNALLPIFGFVFAYLFLSLCLTAWRGRGLSWKIFTPTAMGVFLFVIAAFFVLRNLPFYPFTFLAP
ncbi:MAG: DUF2752 domain-containing protein [Acidobacteriota bacterium]|nr:DUF2752 domain-containing protein [Acidobacteriota bacterium]